MVLYKNHDKLVKEKSAAKNSSKVSGIKATKRSQIPSKVKKQMKNETICRHKIPQSCFFMDLIFVILETGIVK